MTDAYSSYQYNEERKAKHTAMDQLEKLQVKLKAARKEIKQLKAENIQLKSGLKRAHRWAEEDGE